MESAAYEEYVIHANMHPSVIIKLGTNIMLVDV